MRKPVFGHGRLRLYLLKLLDEGPRHGYEVISLLEDRFMGLYAPSPGTVYPRLQRLEADGLVTHSQEGGRKVYRITDAGREELRRRGDELADLEAAGVGIIQVDEPVIREGLPLRRDRQAAYLAWAVACYRLATAGVRDETQVHTHMCYSEFGEILGAIGELDADVTSIEAARSGMLLVNDLQGAGYGQEIGLGVYDIHSPRVPPVAEMQGLLEQALGVLAPEQLWVNPDCGLKTRTYEEVVPALRNMVAAARAVRAGLG